jgi:hypothetical protein
MTRSQKENLCIMKTQRHNTIKTVIVLGRIYGLSHLLSSERLLNIYQTPGNVKRKNTLIQRKTAVLAF